MVLLVPLVQGAPEIRDVSLATVFVDASTDFIIIQITPPTAVGATLTLTAPNGEQATFTRNNVENNRGRRAGFYLDGSGKSTAGSELLEVDEWNFSGDLDGAPADGTWQITFNPNGGPTFIGGGSTPRVSTLAIGGQTITWAFSIAVLSAAVPNIHTNAATWHQNWNQHLGSWVEPSTTPTQITATTVDRPNEAPQEDPNEARFFRDSAPNPPLTAATTQNTVSCSVPNTATINGAWINGVGTVFSQHLYHDGQFAGAPDLRSIAGTLSTTEENEGTTPNGLDAKTVPYNNAAGVTYQFKARDTSGEALGAALYIPAGQCPPVQPPQSLSFNLVPMLTVSQAQCSLDAVSFSIDVDLTTGQGLNDLDVAIRDALTGTLIANYDDSQMFNVQVGQVQYFADYFLPGSYIAVAVVDVGGLGSADQFDSVAFNVPFGPCTDTPTDLSPVLTALALNHANLTSYLDHINAHLHGLNASHGEILDAVMGLDITITGNFTIDNETLNAIYDEILEHRNHTLEDDPNMHQFNGLGFDGFLLLLFWIAALLFFSYQRWWFSLAFTLPGIFNTLFPDEIPGTFDTWFVFCLFGIVMELAANRFGWGRYKENKGT